MNPSCSSTLRSHARVGRERSRFRVALKHEDTDLIACCSMLIDAPRPGLPTSATGIWRPVRRACGRLASKRATSAAG